MSEPISAELSIFLRAVREELLNPASPTEDPFKPARAQRFAAAIDHLLMRTEEQPAIDAALAGAVEDIATRIDAFSGAQPHPAAESDELDGSVRLATALERVALEARNAAGPNAEVNDLISAARLLLARRKAMLDEALTRSTAGLDAIVNGTLEEVPPLTGDNVTAFLRGRFPDKPDVRVENFVRPIGVYSKENYSFDLVGLEERPIRAILRRDRSFEIIPTSAAGEFDLLNRLYAMGHPVARCIAAQADNAAPLMRPCLIMERVEGSPPGMARTTPDDKEAAARIAIQLAAPLARLHAIDVDDLPLPDDGRSNRESFIATLDDYRERLHRHQRESYPLVEAAIAWLYNNSHLIDDTRTLVHADYDLRNVLFADGKLSAILDFELAHRGHPAEDLGYLAIDVIEVMPWGDFMAAYHAAGGRDISDDLVHFFHVWRWTFHAVCNIVAFTGYRSGVHRDPFLGTVSFVEFHRVQNQLLKLLPGGDTA